MDQNKQKLDELLTPSWLSGLAVVVISLSLVISTAVLFAYRGSQLQLIKDNTALQSHQIDYDGLDESLSANTLISDIPLFLFWGAVGFIAYSFTINIASSFRRAVEFEHELDYVHADRRKMINQTLQHLSLRIAALILWVVYLQLTRHVLLPYVLALTNAGAGGLGLITSVAYLGGAFLIGVVCLHIHVVLVRLIFLRPRLFGQAA